MTKAFQPLSSLGNQMPSVERHMRGQRGTLRQVWELKRDDVLLLVVIDSVNDRRVKA